MDFPIIIIGKAKFVQFDLYHEEIVKEADPYLESHLEIIKKPVETGLYRLGRFLISLS